MDKYLVLFQKAFIKSIEYRSEILVWLILDITPTLILLVIWTNIYQGKIEIAGYNLSQILQYYMIGILFRGLTASHFENWRVEQIRLGKIDFFLTRPLPYLMEIFIVHLAGKLYYALITIFVYALMWMMINNFMPLGFPDLTLVKVVLFTLLIVASFFIEFFFGLITVLLGFWFEGSDGLEHFKWILVSLFSGWLIPISMSPNWLQKIILSLPFKYMYAVPIDILQDKYYFKVIDIVYICVLLFILLITSLGIWQKAKLKYASAGG